MFKNIVLLTGAGISVASGLPTYRGTAGLWTKGGVNLATREAMDESPLEVWNTFSAFRQNIPEAQPNVGHQALADFERDLPIDVNFTLITQNIDGLHLAAGSQNVVQLHGDIMRTRCDAECGEPAFADTSGPAEVLPTCKACGAPLRPDIVLFGELLPGPADWAVKLALRNCDLFVAIGTSGSVSPASSYVRAAAYNRAKTVLINPEAMDPPNPYFQEHVQANAEIAVPEFFAHLAL